MPMATTTPEQIFSIANGAAALAWLLLAVLPRRRWVTNVVTSTVVPAGFALAYVLIVFTQFLGAPGSFSSLSGVQILFRSPWLLLAGWLHYLAFDLLVGAWEVRDANERGIPRFIVVPCLFLTFMFGPMGWLLYRVVSASRARALPLNS